MSYVDYSRKDDMQDETYSLITRTFEVAANAYLIKNADMLYTSIRVLYTYTQPRMSMEKKKEFKDKLEEVSSIIYQQREEEDEQVEYEMTNSMDVLMELLDDIAFELDQLGILYKMRTDPDKIVTRGGHH